MVRIRAAAQFLVAFFVLAGAVGPGVVVADGERSPVNSVETSPSLYGPRADVAAPTDTSVGDHQVVPRLGQTGHGNSTTASEAVAPSANASGPADAAAAEVGVRERIVLRRDDERGYFRVTYEYDLSEGVKGLNLTVPFEYQFVEAEDFRKVGPSKVRWTDGANTSTPSVTFRVIADVGDDDGRFSFVDAGDWAIVRSPERSLNWTSVGRAVDLESTTEVAGEGVAGGGMAYLGPHETYVARAEDETIRLVVPEAADLADPPGKIVDALARASDELDVGATSEEVTIIAAPTGSPDWVTWAALGVQRGPSAAWVRDDASLTAVDSTWFHEYVHTRQDFRTGTDFEAEWLVEAQAEYYASVLSLEAGYASSREFRSNLEVGRHPSFEDVVLTDRTTWRGTPANYLKGALVVGRLDYELRAGTDGGVTFEDVFRGMNAHQGRIDHETFVRLVRKVGGDDVATAADRYADTDATPTLWSQQAHESAFGSTASPVVYEQPTGGSFGVESVFRTASLAGDPLVATGENVTAAVTVRNTASYNATYQVALVVDGKQVASAWGVLGPGERRTVTLSHAFDETGRYELRLGDATTTVTVREPATPSVTGLSLNASSVRPGDPVTATATVTNDADVPGERVVEFVVDGRVVASERVRLAPGESTTVRATVRRSETGTVTVSAGEATAQLRVTELTPTPTESTSGVDSPGFTAVGGGLAVLAAMALAARRRSVTQG
ncbi:hypothetical protein BRC81_08590 [Halobacteriales archaeon QS_1_68_20]|nr:MAG: hypothetical protein BRC81_08590 [Halobacteriales archaeon QS_1_68_20]